MPLVFRYFSRLRFHALNISYHVVTNYEIVVKYRDLGLSPYYDFSATCVNALCIGLFVYIASFSV